MEGEISNKTLAALLIIAIAVSVIGVFSITSKLGDLTSITGMITNGTANLTVSAITAINFTNPIVDWGSGAIDGDYTNCTMDTGNGTTGTNTGCVSFNVVDDGFVLENIGDTCADLKIFGDYNATELFNTTAQGTVDVNLLQFLFVDENESVDDGLLGTRDDSENACTAVNAGFTWRAWTDMPMNISNAVTVCDIVQSAAAKDELVMEMKVRFGQDGLRNKQYSTGVVAIASKVDCQ